MFRTLRVLHKSPSAQALGITIHGGDILLLIRPYLFFLAILLLSNGVIAESPNAQEKLDSALVDAAFNDRKADVELLLKQGANPNAISNKITPLMASVPRNNITVICPLGNAGADMNKPFFPGGFTPLRFALELKYPEVALELIRCGASPNNEYKDKVTDLDLAVIAATIFKKEAFVPVIRLMLFNGASPHGARRSYSYPLAMAISYGNEEITNMLMSAGASLNRVAPDIREYTLQEAAEKWGPNSPIYRALSE